MGHRTKINVSVDSHNEIVIRGKLGNYDAEIAQTLSEAVATMRNDIAKTGKTDDLAMAFYEALSYVNEGRQGLYSDIEDDKGMDVHVDLNFDSLSDAIHINYSPDNGTKFEGDFVDFEDKIA